MIDLRYIAHYGIKGQRWGERNGPPYPLDRETASKVRMNAKQEVHSFYEDIPRNKRKHEEHQLSDLKKRPDNMSEDDVLRRINSSDGNDDYGGRYYNCQNCSVACELTLRGYNVKALQRKNGSNVGRIEKAYEGGKLKNVHILDDDKKYDGIISEKTANDFYKDAANASNNAENIIRTNEPAGSRGIIVVGWYNDPHVIPKKNSLFNNSPNYYEIEKTHCYHAMNYEITPKGTLIFYDTQSHRDSKRLGTTSLGYLTHGYVDPREFFYMRTDNLEPSKDIFDYINPR